MHTVLSQWIPPHERAKAVSLTTSGMYLGSAASMWLLPSLGRIFGANRLLQLDGALGMTWLVMWLLVGREIPHRCEGGAIEWAERLAGSSREIHGRS